MDIKDARVFIGGEEIEKDQLLDDLIDDFEREIELTFVIDIANSSNGDNNGSSR